MENPLNSPNWAFSELTKPTGWRCYLLGSTEQDPGLVWYPKPQCVPNAFQRWMSKVFFACTWAYENETN